MRVSERSPSLIARPWSSNPETPEPFRCESDDVSAFVRRISACCCLFHAPQENNSTLPQACSSRDPSKVCAVQQGPVGVAQKLFEDNKEMIRGAGHVIESTVISAYSDS